MTVTTNAPAQYRPSSAGNGGVNFFRALRSEWIKVFSLRSTVILLAITVVVMIGIGALTAWSVVANPQFRREARPEMQAQIGTPDQIAAMAYEAPSSGLVFGQLLIGSLAVVLIASEWGTGMIRSTMVAVPTRIPALLAKNVIIAVVAFVIGAFSAWASYLVAQPILAQENLEFAITADGVLPSILNTGTNLALVAILAMSIGTLLRNTAGGITTTIGLLMVVPIIAQLIQGLADWIEDAARFLPSNAGTQLVAIEITDDALTQFQGGLVLGAWALVTLAVSLIVTRQRDV
jgi:ABC-2 type transport system permease protein